MNTPEIFNGFEQKRIIVLGDVMVDSYVHGRVSRVSPEAPVPVVDYEKTENRLGGAANVALNLNALGARAIVCSVVGDDTSGNLIGNLFAEYGVDCAGMVFSYTRKTTVKTRVLGGNQQLLRIDDEQTDDISTEEETQLLRRIREIHETDKIDAIIFEDYNKGVLTASLIESVIAFANEQNIATTVDPKKANFFAYRNVSLFKPNLKELREGLGMRVSATSDEDLQQAIGKLHEKLKHAYTLVTLSEHGVVIAGPNTFHREKAHVRNISDVSGAGDTVIAVATLCLVSGLSPEEIAGIANIAGGLVCEKSGVVSVDRTELMEEIQNLMLK